MVTCADTSFLFSLYGNDAHTPRAVKWLSARRSPVTITVLNEFELANALRFAEFRGLIARGQAALFWTQFEADRAAGRLLGRICNLGEVVDEAMRLSAGHTLAGGHRGFDILHVAAALHLGADRFLTFDRSQKRLATAAGLTAPL